MVADTVQHPSIYGEWGHTGEDFSGSFSDENIVQNVQSSSGLVSCTGVSRQMLMVCASRVQTSCPPWTTLPRLCLFQRHNMQGDGPSLALHSSDHLAPWGDQSLAAVIIVSPSASPASEARLL